MTEQKLYQMFDYITIMSAWAHQPQLKHQPLQSNRQIIKKIVFLSQLTNNIIWKSTVHQLNTTFSIQFINIPPWHKQNHFHCRITRRSENDDTPQPLDRWTNSPFIGQQVGNWSICHALWPIRKPIVHPTLYPTHISFIPSQSNFPFLKYGY